MVTKHVTQPSKPSEKPERSIEDCEEALEEHKRVFGDHEKPPETSEGGEPVPPETPETPPETSEPAPETPETPSDDSDDAKNPDKSLETTLSGPEYIETDPKPSKGSFENALVVHTAHGDKPKYFELADELNAIILKFAKKNKISLLWCRHAIGLAQKNMGRYWAAHRKDK